MALTSVPDAGTDEGVPVIKAGVYHLNLTCPNCGAAVMFPVELLGRLTVDPDQGKLRPRLLYKGADHKCGQAPDTEPMF